MKNKALTGVLLSGLVYPGLGQFVLKHFVRGAVIMSIVAVSMYVMVTAAVEHALVIMEKILNSGRELDLLTIVEVAHESATASESLKINLLAVLLLCCWLFSAFDAYRIGKRMDLAESLAGEASEQGGRPGPPH